MGRAAATPAGDTPYSMDDRVRSLTGPSFDLLNRSDYAGVAYKDASGPRKG